jgi:hypothetical protein
VVLGLVASIGDGPLDGSKQQRRLGDRRLSVRVANRANVQVGRLI